MSKVDVPSTLKARLGAVAQKHGFANARAFADHLVDRGLSHYGAQGKSLEDRLNDVVESQGYSSAEEVVEHLLERGLRAYEEPEDDPEKLAARLRGLGYID